MAEPGLFLRLFSTPEVRALGSETPLLPVGKPLALFAFLAVENRPVSRDELAALLWPGTDPLRGKASVRQALWNIRKALDTNPFATDEPLTLRLHTVENDLARFREALDTDNLETARGLWVGPLLEGLEFPRNAAWSHWLDQIRTREEQRFGAALATAAEKARSLGTLTLASSLFETAVAILPESATLHVALVETLLESRAYREAEEAMAVARRALEESERSPDSGRAGGPPDDASGGRGCWSRSPRSSHRVCWTNHRVFQTRNFLAPGEAGASPTGPGVGRSWIGKNTPCHGDGGACPFRKVWHSGRKGGRGGAGPPVGHGQ